MSEDLLFTALSLGAIIVVGLITFALAVWIGLLAFAGAAVLLAFAAGQGFAGLVAYFAAWVFMFPLMLVASAVTGFQSGGLVSDDHRREKAKWNREDAEWETALWRHRHLGEPHPGKQKTSRRDDEPPDDPDERYQWANRLPPYDQ